MHARGGIRNRLFVLALGAIASALVCAEGYLATTDHGPRSVQTVLIGGAFLGAIGAVFFAAYAASLAEQPMRELAEKTERMTTQLSVGARVEESGAAGNLAEAIDHLVERWSGISSTLEDERDRLEAILEAMAEGVLVTDGDGQIILANHALREMFYVGRDIIGSSPIEAFRNAELHDGITESMRTRVPGTREITVDGVRPRKLLMRVTVIDDVTKGTVSVLTDVTELRRLETIRRDFVANVSHELRTPIAAVRAGIETLESGAINKPDTAREFVSIVSRHAVRLQQIVEDLLDLSRIEAKELKLVLEPLDVATAAERAMDLSRLAADKKRIEVVGEIDRSVGNAKADSRALAQILSNLVDNAIKYSPEGSRVTVRVGRGERGVRISVIDRGPGIARKHLGRIFERFYRVDAGRSRQVGGTGLGLAIVKHLTDAIDGAVSVESTLNVGTTFHVDLRSADLPVQTAAATG